MAPISVIIGPILISFLHNVFTALWIGGMMTLAFTVLPAIMKVLGKSKETQKLNSLIKKKLSLLTYISLVGLIITGLLMSNKAAQSGLSTGFLSFGNEYSILMSIKHDPYEYQTFVILPDGILKFVPQSGCG
jgi:uncharacterized membrane protein